MLDEIQMRAGVKQEIGIEAHYTKTTHYEDAANQSRRLNILYDNYLQIGEKIFVSYKEFSDDNYDLIRAKDHERSAYVGQLKQFLRKFAEIIKDTAIFQIDCNTQMRMKSEDIVGEATKNIIDKVVEVQEPQSTFRKKHKQASHLKEEIIQQYENLKSEAGEAIHFYNPKLMINKAKAIQQKIGQINECESTLTKAKQKITHNAYDFERYLNYFRKKLLQNKYNMLTKMHQQCKNNRNCLTEIILFLYECVTSKLQAFVTLVKRPPSDSVVMSQSKGRKKVQDIDSTISNLMNSIQEYNDTIDELEGILKGFDASFKVLNNKVAQMIEGAKPKLLENMNNLYSIEESPSRQVNQSLDLFSFFTSKICGISDKLYLCCNQLTKLRNNVKKHSDVTLSLLRMNQRSKKTDDIRLPQVDQLYQQISYDFIVEAIQEVYRAFKDATTEVKNVFSQKFYKKKKKMVNDSMEISHIEDSMFAFRKKPCKGQIWLWRQWRDKTNYTFSPFAHELKKVTQFLGNIKEEPQTKELNKFECVLVTKKDTRGVLKVCQKALIFISFSNTPNSANLHIPATSIHSVEAKVKIFEKVLVVETDKGEIVFTRFYDVEAAKQFIAETIEKASSGGGKIKKKAAVELTPDEIKHIQDNKDSIESKRPSIEGMKKINQIFVDNVTIDQVYDVIYSDKQFSLRGKPEESFFAYVAKKSKNFNYVAGPYENPGPEFYTSNPDAKFNTCSLSSARVNQFDHPIPPMPFMPKFCHCKDMATIYWLSHEHFDYSQISISSGAPYADTFEVRLVHRVQKKGTGVEVEVHAGLFFVKQTSMKGMLESKGDKQMVDNANFTLTEIERSLKILSGGGQEAKEQNEGNTQQNNAPETRQTSQVDRLRSQNKLLIGALVGVFLLNLILRMILD